MYAPAPFREERLPVLHEFIRDHGFASLITSGPDGIQASHVPLILDQSGALWGHLARANPQWRDLTAADEVLAIFQGPQAYISPSWYPAKQEHGRVVPTWDYLAVHAYGRPRVFEDAASLRSLLETLTDQHESKRPEPWKVSDAPAEYIEAAARAIVGFELTVTRIEGVWKMSQNRSRADQAGTVAGLMEGSAMDQEVAGWIERLGDE